MKGKTCSDRWELTGRSFIKKVTALWNGGDGSRFAT
jgi:hypothetical protein